MAAAAAAAGSVSGNPSSNPSGNPSDNPSDSGTGSGSGNSGNRPSNGSPSGSQDVSDENTLGVYVNGGKPIPSEGLGGLGLATAGATAVSAVTAYAITTQNDLTTARHAVNGLQSRNPTSAGVKAVVGAVTTLASGQYY